MRKEIITKMNCKNEKSSFVVSLEVSNFASDGDLYCDLQKCCEANTVEDQLKCLKQLSTKYLYQMDSANSVNFIAFVVNMFIAAEPKNPMKTAIVKILSAVSSQHIDLILQTLEEQLVSKVLKVGVELFSYNVNTMKNLNNLVSTLSVTINFPMGQESLAKNFRLTSNFLNKCLYLFHHGLKIERAPSTREELYLCVHNAVRVFASLYQCCYPYNNRISSSRTRETIEEQTEELFDRLLKVFCCLLIVEDLPLDVGNTCALALVTLTCRERDGLWREVLSVAVTGKNSSYVGDLLSPSIMTRLNLCSGLLGGLSIKDQLLPLEENLVRFSPLAMILYFLLELTHITPCKPMLELGSARGIQKALRVIASVLTVDSVFNGVKKFEKSDVESNVCSLNDGSVNCELKDCKHYALELITNVSSDLLCILWYQLEHFLDSIRHAARIALQTYAQIAYSLETEGNKCLVLELQKSFSDLLPFRRARYIALSAIASSGSRQFVVALFDTLGITPYELVRVIMSPDSTNRPHASAAFEAIMSACTPENLSSSDNLHDWLQHWVQPVLQSLSRCSHLSSRVELEKLLMKAVERHPKEIVSLVLKASDNATANEHYILDTLSSLMICLRAARVNGFFDSASDTELLWKDILPFDLLHRAAIHFDDEVRLGSMALVVETHRSTEPPSAGELIVVRTVLEHSASSELASTRQRCIAFFKRLLMRINDCSTPAAQRRQNNSIEVAELCSTFLNWSVEFAISNLFPGANFGRRSLCLQILNLLVEVSKDVPDYLWLPNNGSVLIDILKDSYEENKCTALKILKHFPSSSLKMDNVNFITSVFYICEEMAKSIRPPNSLTAAYLLQMIASFPTESVCSVISKIQSQSKSVPNLVLPEENNSFQLHFCLLHLYSFIFEQQVTVAERNLKEAASVGPMYGVVLCIRFLLKDLNLQLVACDANWSHLINRIIKCCYRASEAVEPIVNSSSPEGHIPMDVQLVSDILGTSGEGLNDCQNYDVTAQQVLLCAWRTVKETSLLLGWLALHAPLDLSVESSSCAFMNQEQLLVMGEHFTRLLSEVKHRGAFEQVYVGFCYLCSRIWSLSGSIEDDRDVPSAVHDLPVHWLNELLNLIASSGDTYASRLCSTRRSAGVPFLVQALLSTQPASTTCTPVFQRCMEKLLDLAEGPSNIDSKTHSLNILRAVFRSAGLREPSVSYVTRCVKVAVYCCRAENWMVRNAATLLFSTLLIRLFGVGRPGSRLRRTTGRVFFHQYPLLFDFLLNEISTSSQETCLSSTRSMHHFPALLLLSCLHPNSLEGTDSNLQLSHFVPLINSCAGNVSECTRKLAARALAPLVSPGDWTDLVDHLLSSTVSEISWNKRHGLLLQVISLLRTFSLQLIEEENVQKRALEWLTSSKHLLRIRSQNISNLNIPCFISAEAFVQVIQVLVDSFLRASFSDHKTLNYDISSHSSSESLNEMPLFNHSSWFSIYSTIAEELKWLKHEKVNQSEPGLCLYQMHATQLLLMLTSILEREKVLPCINEMLSSEIPEVVFIALKFVHFSLGHTSMSLPFEASYEELENTQPLPIFVHALPSFITSTNLAKTIAGLFFENECILLPDSKIVAFKLIIHLPLVIKYIANFLSEVHLCDSLEKVHPGELVLEWLLKELETDAEGVGPSIIALLGFFILSVKYENLFSLASLSISKSSFTLICSTLEKACSPEYPLVIRMSVAEVISSQNFSLFLCNPPFQDCFLLALCHLWTAAIQLLDDDSSKIRSLVCSLAVQMVPDCKGMPTSEIEARKLLVLKFVSVLEFHDSLIVAVSLTFWILQHCNVDEENLSEDQLFDETETNLYGESLLLSLIASASLARLIQQTPSLSITPLETSVREWLINHIWKLAPLQNTVSQIPDVVKRSFHVSGDSEWSTLKELADAMGKYLFNIKANFLKSSAISEEICGILYPASMYCESVAKRLSLLQEALNLVD